MQISALSILYFAVKCNSLLIMSLIYDLITVVDDCFVVSKMSNERLETCCYFTLDVIAQRWRMYEF